MIMKDFLADLAQWLLCSVVLGHSFSLFVITLQVGRTWKARTDGGLRGGQGQLEGEGVDDHIVISLLPGGDLTSHFPHQCARRRDGQNAGVAGAWYCPWCQQHH